MEDFYLSQALFRTQEILDNFTKGVDGKWAY